jgi:hypothetical protein
MNKLLATVALCAAAWLPAATWAAPVLSITPSSTAVAVGGSFSVDLSITGLSAMGEVVSAYDLNMLFNNTFLGNPVVSFDSTLFGGAANVDFSSTAAVGNTGLIMNSFSSDDDLALLQTAASFSLGRLTFTGLAAGDSFLSLGPDADFDRLVVGRNGAPLDLVYVGACVSVGASAPGTGCQNGVPEPASYALAGLALLAGAAARRMAQRTQPKA